MSFTRRYQSFPPSQVISQIEGVVIVDLPAPASIQGVSTGVVGVIGEFADMRYATSVDGNGNVSTKLQPVEVTSAQDLINKVGGWDSTLGEFGGDDGNGFMTVYGKRFSRLILCPVNLASSKAVRLFRELPTNRADAATPIGTLQGVGIAAGTEFKSGSNRVHLATAATFTATPAYAKGSDGETPMGVSAVEHSFLSAGASFITAGVQPGDALVIGRIGVDDDAGTYRIVTVPSETSLTFEKQDGSAFVTAGGTGMFWRIHEASVADTGSLNTLSGVGGYTLPARPLDATISANTSLLPTSATAAGTATAWNPRSGLTMRTGASALTYTAAIQAPNAPQSSSMDALYTAALDAFLADSDPVREIAVVVTSRTSETIRNATKTHVLSASSTGRGRLACMAPPINEVDEATVLGDEYVEANRDERVIFCWPGVKQFIEPAVGTRTKLASGAYSVDGLLDVRADIFMASVLSNLASERNPGQSTDPVPLCLSPILAFQSGNLPGFTMTDYILFKQNGVCAIRFDRTAGKLFQSGVTTSLNSSQKNINRRRMADEIQDSLAGAYANFVKQPLTNGLKSSINSETVAYLAGLKSANNPAAQRIEDFSVDAVSGNTPELAAQGIHVVIVRVKMLATADDIVLQAEVGQSVNITTA